ncbi:MAG TPA: glycosyltransferase family 39 protein [Rhodopila sp.]|nr:glycosyltransferase family 39 protein [Rhodopila sp.]
MRDKPLLWALLGLTVLRLIVAAMTPLSPDEAYYWVWSHALAPAYLDHPFMVALWIAAGTASAGQTELGVRLLGPLGCLGASWLLLDAGRRLFPGTSAGRVAVLLLNASLILGVGSVIMTPDTPLLVFWTATLWAAARLATGGAAWWWLVAGMCAGLALDSKYTALFLWVGLGVWVVVTPSLRVWLRRWQPYAGGILGLALFTPVLVWNAHHAWAGLLKQGGRVNDWQPQRAIGFLAELVGGQAGLATPVIFGLCMVGLAVAVRRGWRGSPAWSLLASFSAPPILVFLQHAIGDRVQGNWPAIIYPALALAAGGAALPRRWITTGLAIGFGVTLLTYVQATTQLLPLPPRFDPVSLRLAGWSSVAAQVADTGGDAGFLAVEGYAPASELAWWNLGPAPILGADARWRLTTLPLMSVAGRSGLLVREGLDARPPDAPFWSAATRLGSIVRPGGTGRGFTLFRVTGADQARLAVLPGR